MTILMPYYENYNMLKMQIQYWKEYSLAIRNLLELVIVDDGSRKNPAEKVLSQSDLSEFQKVSLYRIDQDKPWNHMGARNLGFHVASDGWILSTDMDQVVSWQSMKNLMKLNLDQNCFYRPARFYKNQLYKRHNDTYIIHRDSFWQIGGYDEDFSGYYGGGSTLFYRQLKNELTEVLLNEDIYTLHFEGLIEDASTDRWDRQDSGYYYKNSAKMNELFRLKANSFNYKPKNPMRFKWEKVI